MPGSPPLVPAALGRRLRRRRLIAPPFTVLVFDSGYHLQAEIAAAVAALGHRPVTIAIGGRHGAQRAADAMRALLRALLAHQPDLVVSINHIGFDADGLMGRVLEETLVPTAVWYVDSPVFIHQGFFLAAPAVTTVWSWERAYVPLLRRLGAADVQHLPLACQPERFASPPPAAGPATPALGGDDGIVFVGSSLGPRAGPWWRQLSAAEAAQSDAQAARLAAGADLMMALGRPAPTPDRRMTVLAQACLRATAAQRQTHLAALAPLPLILVGDDGWRARLPAAQCRPPLPYGPSLAAVYRRAAINLNVTSLQMPTAVNQRLFDVPAAGGFLLTDDRADADVLFPADALATYEGAGALAEEARFFLARPGLRRQIAERARRCVLARHTYVHRVETLIAHMRARWAGGGPTRRPGGPS